MKKISVVPYSFNEDYMKEVSKKDFLEAHKHLEGSVDLSAEWEKHNQGKESTVSLEKEKAKPAQA